MSIVREVQVTCPDEDTAARIGRKAVEGRLSACANIMGPVRSIYRWKGQIEEDTEWTLLLKTAAGQLDALIDLVRENHPYELPAILVHESETDAETERWVLAELGERSGRTH